MPRTLLGGSHRCHLFHPWWVCTPELSIPKQLWHFWVLNYICWGLKKHYILLLKWCKNPVPVLGSAVAKPCCNSTSQYALNGAAVKIGQYSAVHAKFPQSPQKKEPLFRCPCNHTNMVCPAQILADIDTKKSETFDSLHSCAPDVNGCMFSLQPPVVHYQLLGFCYIKGPIVCPFYHKLIWFLGVLMKCL